MAAIPASAMKLYSFELTINDDETVNLATRWTWTAADGIHIEPGAEALEIDNSTVEDQFALIQSDAEAYWENVARGTHQYAFP